MILSLSKIQFIKEISSRMSRSSLKSFVMEQYFHERLTADDVEAIFNIYSLRSL